MFTIIKEFSFSASHQLLGLPEEHPCSRLHGHNYVVEVELQSEQLNDIGFVRDYRELDKFKRYIDDTLDHRHLNEVFACNPTAELLAITLFAAAKQFAPEVVAVRVSETPKTWAEYRPAKIYERSAGYQSPPFYGPSPIGDTLRELEADNCIDNFVREGLINAFAKENNDS